MARTGRRPGDSGARDAIVGAARTSFATRGYDATSMRGIARDAAVDPALVHHYFDGKPALFAAAMELPFDPSEMVPTVLAGPPDELGERLTRFFLSLWDTPANRQPMLALVRSAVSHDAAAGMLRGFVTEAILGRVARTVAADDADLRATLVGSQLIGLVMARYVVRVEPLASTDVDTVVRWVAPTVQRYLTA